MGSVTEAVLRFQQPMPPDPPFDPREPRVKDPYTRTGELGVFSSPQHAPAVLPQYDQPTDSQLELLDTQDALERIAGRIGWQRLARIVRNLAFVHGESV